MSDTQAQELTYYVQLGVFGTPAKLKQAEKQALPVGKLHTEDAGSGRSRLLLGGFRDRTSAEQSLNDAKQRGFSDAFIVERGLPSNGGKNPTNTTDKADSPAPLPPIPNKVWLIQVGAYNAQPPASLKTQLSKLGTLYTEKNNKIQKIYVGYFSDMNAADQTLQQIKKIGYEKAFKKEIDKNIFESYTLWGKGDKPSTAPVGSPIAFGDKTTFMEDLAMFSNGNDNDTIEISGSVVPISATEMLLVGSLDPYSSEAYQPLLLRTADRGATWEEVLQAEYGHSVLYIEFLNAKVAYLATMWVIEGPGEVVLFKTEDGGKTWQKTGRIPRNDFYCMTNYLHFSTPQKGSIVYTCSEDGYWLWETDNAGLKWKNKGKLSEKNYKKLKNNHLIDYTPKSIYKTPDGKTSFKQETVGDVMVFQIKPHLSRQWYEMCRLNRWFKLKNKQLIPYE